MFPVFGLRSKKMNFDKEIALGLIKDSFDSLSRSGTIEGQVNMKPDLVVLGSGSPLDSIGFVTFVTELEDRIQAKTNEEHYLVLSDINDFNINNPALTVDVLAQYLVKLVRGNA